MIPSSFWNHAQAAPDHLALVEPDGTEHSAGALLAACNQVVHGLRSLGLQAGDTVAVVIANSAPILEVALAAGQAGIYITPINHHLTAHEVAFILSDCEAKAVVCSAKYASMVTDAMGRVETRIGPDARLCVGGADGFVDYEEWKAGRPTSMPEGRLGGFVMTYTSGTTGRPRGVRRPFGEVPPDHLADNFTGFLKLFGIGPEGVHLVTSPMYHTAVINWCLYSLHYGHTAILMDEWSAQGTLDAIAEHRVTHSHMVPTHFSRMLALPEEQRRAADTSSITHLVHGAAPCPIPVKHAMLEWFGPVVYEYYAASEGGGTTATPEQWLARPGTVGAPWPISTIRILDDDLGLVPAGEIGTVWIRMGEHTFEYHGDEDKTKRAWNDGFFTVGDAGYVDEDGFLFLVDRKSDMIISGGVNIYPAEIECELITHPEVADCAVFGIPNDDWGEEIKAVVEPIEGVVPDDALVARLYAFCRERLAGYKCPRSIDFTDALPRDPNGKLYKRRLRDPYWEGRERAI
jgi:long-chain acyl-CoA synthetase